MSKAAVNSFKLTYASKKLINKVIYFIKVSFSVVNAFHKFCSISIVNDLRKLIFVFGSNVALGVWVFIEKYNVVALYTRDFVEVYNV